MVLDDDVGAGLEGGGEVGPGNKRREIENWIGQTVGGKLGQAAEEKSENTHGHERLEDNPSDADDGLFVADFNVAPDEEVEELAVSPDFGEAKLEKAARGLNANSGGGARVDRERRSLRRCGDGCHDDGAKTPKKIR